MTPFAWLRQAAEILDQLAQAEALRARLTARVQELEAEVESLKETIRRQPLPAAEERRRKK